MLLDLPILKKGSFYFIKDGDTDIILEDNTKRGLEVKETSVDEELKQNYEPKGVTPDKDVICYCRIGERSSHSWFVLKYLLGYSKVRNYDGSWTEWGNMIGNPVEK